MWEQAIIELNKKLDPALVKSRQQGGQNLSYVEAWHCIAEANRIFGYDGWKRETVYCKEVCRYAYNDKQKVGYEAMVRITIGDVVREGTGHGSGIAKDLFDCIEGAAKEAESDAMKRALMTFGNPFGLALYDKTKAMVGVDETPEQIAEREKAEAEAKRKAAQEWVNGHLVLVEDAETKEQFERLKAAPQRERIRAAYPDFYAIIVEYENKKEKTL
jgi:DNA recombination protein Rad52